VLSENYLDSSTSLTKWKHFFESYLNAKDKPPYQVVYTSLEQLPSYMTTRWLALTYKERTFLQATEYPEFLWLQNPSEYRDKERASALVQWLDEVLLFKKDDSLYPTYDLIMR
jgi:hypothetical protein